MQTIRRSFGLADVVALALAAAFRRVVLLRLLGITGRRSRPGPEAEAAVGMEVEEVGAEAMEVLEKQQQQQLEVQREWGLQNQSQSQRIRQQ